MKFRVLGCSGGIGGDLRTTSFLIDHDVLIDAGTGVGDLSLSELSMIDHVFVSHSHLDHITSIPFMVDSAGFMRDKPLTVYALQETLELLKKHIFNGSIWPDFTEIPNVSEPYMRYQSIELGKDVMLSGRKVTPLPANHVVPAIGFMLGSGNGSLVFSGDTTTNSALWNMVNKISNLRYIILETAFSNSEKNLAEASKHLCPSLAAAELSKLKIDAEVFITHLKPGESDLTMREIAENIEELGLKFCPKMLMNNQILEF